MIIILIDNLRSPEGPVNSFRGGFGRGVGYSVKSRGAQGGPAEHGLSSKGPDRYCPRRHSKASSERGPGLNGEPLTVGERRGASPPARLASTGKLRPRRSPSVLLPHEQGREASCELRPAAFTIWCASWIG